MAANGRIGPKTSMGNEKMSAVVQRNSDATILSLERSTIRRYRESDVAELPRIADNPRVWRNLRDAFPHPYTDAEARSWIDRVAGEDPATNFAIEAGGRLAGGIGLVLLADVHRRTAEVGYWLGEDYWGRGIASEAVRAFSNWAFENFDVCRLQAGVLAWNPPSRRVLEKAGYTLEGVLRLAITKDGSTTDEYLYALLRPDRALRPVST